MVTSSLRSFSRLASLLVVLGLLLGLCNVGCSDNYNKRYDAIVDTTVSYAFPWEGNTEGKTMPAEVTNLDVTAFDENGKEVVTTLATNIISSMTVNEDNYRVAKIKTRSNASEFQLFFKDNYGAVVTALRFKDCELTQDDYELTDEESQEITVNFSKDSGSTLVMNRNLLVTVSPQELANVSVNSSDETILSPDPNFIGSDNVFSFRILNTTETPVTLTVYVNGEVLAAAKYTVAAAPTLYTLVADYSLVSTELLPEGSVKGATINNEEAILDADAKTVTMNKYEADKYYIAFDIGTDDMVSTNKTVKFDPELAENGTITVMLTDEDFGIEPITYTLVANFSNVTADVFDKNAENLSATIDGQKAAVINTDNVYTATIESTNTENLTVQFTVGETLYTAKDITFNKKNADKDNVIVVFLKDSDFVVAKLYTLVADFTKVTLFDKDNPYLTVRFNGRLGDITREDGHYVASCKNMPAVGTLISFNIGNKEYGCLMGFTTPTDPSIEVLTCEIDDSYITIFR